MDRIDIFRKVALATPDLKSLGGIAAVVDAYRRHFPGIHILSTNSARGTFVGAFALARAFIRIPFLRARGVRILHAHGASGKSFIRKCLLMAWARLWGMKTIFHCHAGPFRDYVARVGVPYVASRLSKCDAVITLSKVHIPLFRDTLGLKDVEVVNNMVEPSAYTRDFTIAGPVTFIFLGLLTTRKGIFELLDAAASLNEKYPGKFRIIVGGDGDEAARFHSRIKELGLASVIDYRGWLRGESKEQALRAAHVTVLPSYAEGTPVSILEGFDRGMPAIASDVGGIPDLVTDGVDGILVAARDHEALAAAMARYIDNPALIRQHAAAAAETVRQFYPDAVAGRLASLYTRILG